jgi:hypothetical protein
MPTGKFIKIFLNTSDCLLALPNTITRLACHVFLSEGDVSMTISHIASYPSIFRMILSYFLCIQARDVKFCMSLGVFMST